ncbi:ATP-binding protein [Kitasatospora cinereorecta]|uniref:ATP-binding protein n=1 Tax=Kitasatospora cinereorecta TaxID=285560 RepID=A0ABW0V5M6_9ACTN
MTDLEHLRAPVPASDGQRAATEPRASGWAVCANATTADAAPALRHFARDTAERWRLPADVVDTLALVVTELVTNVLLHSGSPDVTVLIKVHGASLTVEVRDTGQWRARRDRRRSAEDADALCGRGLELVRHCSSWSRAVLTAAGTRMLVCLPLAGAAA